MLSSYDSSGSYQSGEKNLALLSRLYRPGSGKRLVIYLHGRGQTALEGLDATYGQVPGALAEAGYPVLSVDAGGTAAWANSTAMTRVGQGITAGRAAPVDADDTKAPLLVGTSMGGLTGLKYARSNTVAGVVSLVGALDPDYVHDNDVSGLAAEIETAYTNLSGWNAAVATTAPIEYASELTSTPVACVYSETDTITPVLSAEQFIEDSGAEPFNLGAVGHAITGLDVAAIVNWCEQVAPA